MLPRTIAVNSNCYHGYSIEEAVHGIVAAGFHAIELTATKGWTEHVFPDMSLSRLLRTRRLLEEAGLAVVAMSGHVNLMDEERIADFVDNIELAHLLSAPVIVSSVGEAHLKDRTSAGDDLVASNIRSFLPLLEKYDMHLVLETHGEHGTATRLASIVDLVSSPRVGICYDTANAIFYGDVKGVEDVEANAGMIDYVHIKDKAGERTEWNFPALGDGYVDFPSILSALDRAGNHSPLSIEIEFTSSGAKDLAEVDAAVRRSGEYLRHLGYVL